MAEPLINDVSDTARWVAVYRANETKRSDALFRDPFAERLAGEHGARIASSMTGSMFTEWSIITRTYVIDDILRELISSGAIDTVINLGAGLDTRPYRMDLPANLRWVEVDFPHMIQYKQGVLRAEKPTCRLEQIGSDLADRGAREKLLVSLAAGSKSALILTEGFIPYLTNEQVSELARDLKMYKSFRYWVAEYLSPEVIKHIQGKSRRKHMQNSPFVFNPPDWYGLFAAAGWKEKYTRYLALESTKRGREVPAPWFIKAIRFLFTEKFKNRFGTFSGYVVFERA